MRPGRGVLFDVGNVFDRTPGVARQVSEESTSNSDAPGTRAVYCGLCASWQNIPNRNRRWKWAAKA